MADPTRTRKLSDRLILRGADGYDEARYARISTLAAGSATRLQQIRSERDPSGLFVDYLAGPGGFRNLNGWERN